MGNGPYTPAPAGGLGGISPAPAAAPPGATPPPRSRGFFRWRGIIGLLVFVGLACAFWILFGNRIIKSTIEEVATKSLGVQVDVGSLDLSLRRTTLDIGNLTVAHPADSMRNLVEIRRATVQLEPIPLLKQKAVIRSLLVDSVLSHTRRATPARRVEGGGFLPAALAEANRWTAQFKVPLLSLTPIDTIKALVLDPSQLATVRQARLVMAEADSLRDEATRRFRSLGLAETADSAEALLARLKGQTPRSLGLSGTRTAISDVRRFAARVDSTRRSLETARTVLRARADSVVAGARRIDEARQSDYALARSLLQLPTFDAPNIGPALFGEVSLDAFEQAMTWVTLARDYAPPGLMTKETSGPERLRMSGTTIHFIKETTLPRLHVRHATMAIYLDENAGALRGAYHLRGGDFTSEPMLLGRPMQFSASRIAAGARVESLFVAGVLDHTKPNVQRDEFNVRATRVELPRFALPGVPLRLDLGRGTTALRFVVVNDSVAGRWVVDANSPSWTPDSARSRPMNTLESLVSRVLTGIDTVNITADIRGTTKAPAMTVRSNLDREVADNIRRVAGEEIRKAEARVRAQVDAFVERESAPVKAKVEETRAEIDRRIAEGQERLDKAKADLANRLKELGAGIIG